MKAIRVNEFGGPEVLRVESVPDPRPDRGQVLVRVKAVGVNPVDTYIRSGVYARKPSLPYTPGTDAGGVVEAVGPDVKRFKVGDRVYTNGTITGASAELALCDQRGTSAWSRASCRVTACRHEMARAMSPVRAERNAPSTNCAQ